MIDPHLQVHLESKQVLDAEPEVSQGGLVVVQDEEPLEQSLDVVGLLLLAGGEGIHLALEVAEVVDGDLEKIFFWVTRSKLHKLILKKKV